MPAKRKASSQLQSDIAARLLYVQTGGMSGNNALALASEVIRIIRWSLKQGAPEMPPDTWEG